MAEDYPDPPTAPASVSAADLHRALTDGEQVRLLDVRDRDEFEQWHVDGPTVTASQRPFAKFLQAKVTGEVEPLVADLPGEGPLTVVCARGEASAFVAGLLTEHGIPARNLADGMEGWARLYVAREVPCEAATILQYQRPATGCLSYLVVSDGTAAVVDLLRVFADRYRADAADRDASLRYAVDTHVHADHVSGLRALATEGVEPVLPDRAGARGVSFDVTELSDDPLAVGSATLRPLPLPGHTTGMTGFRVGSCLLAGDSVFVESVARPDLEPGDDAAAVRKLAADLHRTLTERLAALPDDTLVAPGHYRPAATAAADGTYTAPLGRLRQDLRAFALDRDAFVDYVSADLPPRPANFERIVALNLGADTRDGEDTFELELGPNNCAAAPLRAD